MRYMGGIMGGSGNMKFLTYILSAICLHSQIYDIFSTVDGIEQSTDVVQVANVYFANKDISFTSGGLSSSSGSGIFTKMFGVSGGDVVQGFNESQVDKNKTPVNKDLNYDQDSGVGLPRTYVGEVSVVSIQDQFYLEFLYDGSESDSGISLDEFIIFLSPTPIFMDVDEPDVISYFTNNGAEVLFNLDEGSDRTVLLNASSGAGKADSGVYVPLSSANAITGGDNSWEVFIFVRHGELGLYNGVDFSNNGGGEEWAYWKKGVSVNDVAIPEVGTISAGLFLTLLLVLLSYRLDERVYECNNCGMKIDRDYNAAINLEKFYTGSSSEIHAFGDRSSISEKKFSLSLN